MIVELVSVLNAKGSKFWVQKIIFIMEYIEIRKYLYRVVFPTRVNKKASACICVA